MKDPVETGELEIAVSKVKGPLKGAKEWGFVIPLTFTPYSTPGLTAASNVASTVRFVTIQVSGAPVKLWQVTPSKSLKSVGNPIVRWVLLETGGACLNLKV